MPMLRYSHRTGRFEQRQTYGERLNRQINKDAAKQAASAAFSLAQSITNVSANQTYGSVELSIKQLAVRLQNEVKSKMGGVNKTA